MIKDRLVRLRAELNKKAIDGILISQPENRFYLSGFDGSDGYLLITSKDSILATDFRYIEQVKRQSPDYTLFQIKGKLSEWLPSLMGGLQIYKLGFESTTSFTQYTQFSEIIAGQKLRLELSPVENVVEGLRAIKEPEEIDCIRRAAEISDRAFEYVTARLKPGMTEKEVAWTLEKHMRENGSQSMPFEVIVGAGINGALPHAQPSDRPIAEGEPIVIDMGAKFGGYSSDLTRTICLGKPDATFIKIYGIVQRAQETAINGIQAGMPALKADSLSRDIIKEAGYNEMFGHGLGHGVGLSVHDPAPRLSPLSSDVMANGMVFSIEPGIYLPEWGGVRIEDLAILENGRVKLLSKAKKMIA
ncbi:MAG: Xaa-Pro peptidase family protein [Dehalococcoidales bacterium]|nr:Xaa-Pro peptidase family protein [Dehalococcoidales bacterium]